MRKLCVLTIATLVVGGAVFGAPISIDPRSSYLMADVPGVNTVGSPSPTLPDAPISAIFIAVTPGQLINIVALGNLCYSGTAPSGTLANPCNGIGSPNPGPELAAVLGGIFSTDSTLLGITNLQRVPNAVSSGLADYINSNTNLYYHNTISTNNTFDFLIPTGGGVTVVVPATAHFLAVGVFDSFYKDNSDPNGDLAVLITTLAVPEPATYGFMLAGFGGLAAFRSWRSKRG